MVSAVHRWVVGSLWVSNSVQGLRVDPLWTVTSFVGFTSKTPPHHFLCGNTRIPCRIAVLWDRKTDFSSVSRCWKTASQQVQCKEYLSMTCSAASWQLSACSHNNRIGGPNIIFGAFLSSLVFSFTRTTSPHSYLRSLEGKKGPRNWHFKDLQFYI